MKIQIGTCAWTHDDWKGVFYPAQLPAGQRLGYYAKWFDAVEVDSTFYHVPARSVSSQWARVTPEHFRFSCKVPREVTHERKLRDSTELVRQFLVGIEPLGAKLGCLLVQLPPRFSVRQDEQALRDFLHQLPKGYPWAVEFRDDGWRLPRVAHLLEQNGVAWVWNDMTALEAADTAAFDYHPRTTDRIVIRLMGDSATKYLPDGTLANRYDRMQWPRTVSLENWAAKVRLEQDAAEEALIFTNNHFEGYSPETARRMAEKLGMDVRLPGKEEVGGVGGMRQAELWE